MGTHEKWIFINYSSCKRSWKPRRWVRLDLMLTMRDTFINSNLDPLTKFTGSSRSTNFKDILPWNISQMIMKTIPIIMKIIKSYVMKCGILLWISWIVTRNCHNNMIWISQWRESHCRINNIRRNELICEKTMKTMIMKTILISIKIVKSYVMKCGIPLWIWWDINRNWHNNMIWI